jgi:hypothetical protein
MEVPKGYVLITEEEYLFQQAMNGASVSFAIESG